MTINRQCKCEEGTWGSANKNPICRNPVYTEGVLCLNCAHDKDCHENTDAKNTKSQTN